MNFLKNSQTNWRYILILLILAILVGGGIFGYQWWVIKEEIKAPEVKILETENIIKSLLTAETVYIHSDMVHGDIDNDKQEELVVFATVVGGTRPINAGGKLDYEGQKTSSDLMILSREENQYIFKAYFINAFGITNAPKIYLKDFNGDGKLEVILSVFDLESQSYISTSIIYKLEGNQLHGVSFKGGELDGFSDIHGALKLDESKPNQLSVLYGRKEGVSDTYIWNEGGFFEFLSTTSHIPTEIHQLVINYLELNITDIVKEKPVLGATKFYIDAIQFYPENRILTEFEDGHIVGYFLGQYKLENNKIYIEYIDETFDSEKLIELRMKYGLTADNAVNYFRSRQDFKWTPIDLLTLNF